jgi:hypothetical protein
MKTAPLRSAARRSVALGERSHARSSGVFAITMSAESVTEHARRIGALCSTIATGLEVWAKHAPEPVVAANARHVAIEHRDLVDEALRIAQISRPGVRTCERMRWEWLVATASTLDGSPDARLRAECISLIDQACELARDLARAPSCRDAAVQLRDDLERTRAHLGHITP